MSSGTISAGGAKPGSMDFVSAADIESGNGNLLSADGNAGGGAAVAARSTNDDGILNYFQSANHPVAAFFHVAFKIAALVCYLFGSIGTDNFVFLFVVIILLLAADFWTVKNVTGRLMVRLHWTSEVQEDGTSQWKYYSANNAQVGKVDRRIFWWTMYLTPLVWLVLGVVGLLKFNLEWLVVVVVAITLSGTNLVGYYRCDKDAQKKMSEAMQGTAMMGALYRVGGGLTSVASMAGGLFSGGGGGGAGGGAGGGTGGGGAQGNGGGITVI